MPVRSIRVVREQAHVTPVLMMKAWPQQTAAIRHRSTRLHQTTLLDVVGHLLAMIGEQGLVMFVVR